MRINVPLFSYFRMPIQNLQPQAQWTIGSLDVGDDDIVRREALSARLADGEILLVHLHRQAHDFRRQ